MKRKIISIFLIIVLLQPFCGFVFAENITNEEQTEEPNLQDQHEEVKEKIDETNIKLEYVQGELSNTLLRVQEYEDKVLQYQSQMTELGTKLDTLEASINEAKEKLTVVQANYEEKEEILRQRLVAMYEAGETTYLDVLLASRNIVEFISGYFLIEQMVEYDNSLIEEVEAKKKELELTAAKLEKEETELKIIKARRE